MKPRASVVFCTYDSPTSIGGPFTWLRRLLPELREAGIECRVLALTHFGGTGPLIEGLRADGFDVEATDCHDRTEDQVRWILSRLQESPPAVFVPNFVVAAYYAARWLKQAGAATIGVLHSDDAFYRALQREFIHGKREFRLTDVVAVSEKLLWEVRQENADSEVSASYIPYGVGPVRRQAPVAQQPFRIAYVGRLVEEQKRISLVTRTLIAASRELPWLEAVLYGDGPDRGAVERLLSEAGPGLRIRLAGAVSPDQIQPALLECQAIMLMSDYEGLPIALLEGMACGCIPVCRRMESGIPQLVRNHVTGVLVSEHPQDFIAALRWLREHPEEAQKISENARDLIRQKYSLEHSVDGWVRLLRPLLSRRTGPLSVPRRLVLPPRHPELESEQRRRRLVPLWLKKLRRFRIWLGAQRRRVLCRGRSK